VPGFGYTLMCEQSGPREFVRYAAAAEGAGFDFEVISDHYFPWLDAQGHARTHGARLVRSARQLIASDS
jgi:alkanesulfonate monooxygenase SsuD/methylene tetrahydromethanopterin reductase-like flavin-dependent oxidoreductase (luciferase family)